MKLLSSSPKWRSQFFFVCERSELLASLGIWKRRTKCDEGNGIRTQPSLQDTHKVCCTVYDLTAIVASQPVKFLCNLLSSTCLCLKWWRNVTLEMSFDRQQWWIKKQLHTHATFFPPFFIRHCLMSFTLSRLSHKEAIKKTSGWCDAAAQAAPHAVSQSSIKLPNKCRSWFNDKLLN